MKKTIIHKHNNKIHKITKDVALHIDIVWSIAERYKRRYQTHLDFEKLCNEIIDKY